MTTVVSGKYSSRRRPPSYQEADVPRMFVSSPTMSRDRVERVARSLREGPRVLTDLEAYGIHFPEGCRDERYCQADSQIAPGPTPVQMLLNLLAIAVPVVMTGVLVVVARRLRRERKQTESTRP